MTRESTVIIVDDDRGMCDSLSRVLTQRGYGVIACTSAVEFLSRTEIVDAHCQRVVECRGDSYELCVNGLWSAEPYCEAWNPEPECVEDIWEAACEEEMPLPCSCGSGTPGCT